MTNIDYKELSQQILEFIGNKENIVHFTHCFTRLRFNIKNRELVNEKELSNLSGIAGFQWIGDQLQIIVGQEVEELYKIICDLGNIQTADKVDELIPEGEKQKKSFSIKSIFNTVVATITECITPVFIIFSVGGLIKLSVALLGSATFAVLPDDSDIIVLLTMLGDNCFRFLPICVAYTAAKKFDANIPLALILASLLLHPTLAEIVESGKPFTVFGIPMIATTYANSFLPTLLITWILSKVEKFFKKLFPTVIRGILYPLCTVLVMVPIALCILGPVGTVSGSAVATCIVWLKDTIGPIATGLVGALFPFLIITGMHHALNAAALVEYAKNGYDRCIWAASYIMDFQLMSLPFAALIRSKKPEDKILALSCITTEGFGGISEPTIFGFVMKSKRNMAYVLAGGFAGGFYIGLMNVNCYVMAPGGFWSFLAYSGGSSANLINGIIACAIAFLVPFTLALIFGFGNEKEKGVV